MSQDEFPKFNYSQCNPSKIPSKSLFLKITKVILKIIEKQSS